MSNRKSLIFLLTVFLGLVVILIVQQVTNNSDNSSQFNNQTALQFNSADNQAIYPDLSVEDIAAIRLEDPILRSRVTLQRNEDDTWSIQGDSRPIDQAYAESIAQTISLLPYSYVIDGIEPSEYPDYGLSQRDALLFVQVILRDGTGHIIAIGNQTSTRDGYYALVDDNPQLYIIDRDPDPIAYLIVYLEAFENAQ